MYFTYQVGVTSLRVKTPYNNLNLHVVCYYVNKYTLLYNLDMCNLTHDSVVI